MVKPRPMTTSLMPMIFPRSLGNVSAAMLKTEGRERGGGGAAGGRNTTSDRHHGESSPCHHEIDSGLSHSSNSSLRPCFPSSFPRSKSFSLPLWIY